MMQRPESNCLIRDMWMRLVMLRMPKENDMPSEYKEQHALQLIGFISSTSSWDQGGPRRTVIR